MKKKVSASISYTTINQLIIAYNQTFDHLEEDVMRKCHLHEFHFDPQYAREKLKQYYIMKDKSRICSVATAMVCRAKLQPWRLSEWVAR